MAKLGFTQSYTYFAWRSSKPDLTEYFTELTQSEVHEYFRPNLWPNAPDILTEELQYGGRPAFMARLILASTLGASYGIYGPAFELCENRPLKEGSEEYLNSEKYEITQWNIERDDSLKEFIGLVNRIRRENPALQSNERLHFHSTDHKQLICYSKSTVDGSNVILVVVNLSPHHIHFGWVHLDLGSLWLDTHHLAGSLEYVRKNNETVTVAILQGFVHNQGDAWNYTLEAFDQYVVRCQVHTPGSAHELTFAGSILAAAQGDIPLVARECIGPYLDSVSLLGQRTAELHAALATVQDNPDFMPEPFSLEYRRSRYESMGRLVSQTCSLLRSRLNDLPSSTEQEARRVLNNESRMQNRFRAFSELETCARRTRCHGDYHLGQVLWTGRDFLISDFEGEPARPLSERSMKHSPIMDVAGKLRSLYYAPYATFLHQQPLWHVEGAGASLDPWIRFWCGWVSVAFLKSYLKIAERASFWPGTQSEFHVLLDAHLL